MSESEPNLQETATLIKNRLPATNESMGGKYLRWPGSTSNKGCVELSFIQPGSIQWKKPIIS